MAFGAPDMEGHFKADDEDALVQFAGPIPKGV